MREVRRMAVILDLIREIWIKSPDLRLMQLLDNAVHVYGQDISAWTYEDMFYTEDDKLKLALEHFLGKLDNRTHLFDSVVKVA